MKIYIVEEYDATTSYESGADPVEESRSIIGAFFDKSKAEAEAARHNGGRYMRWETVEVEIKDDYETTRRSSTWSIIRRCK